MFQANKRLLVVWAFLLVFGGSLKAQDLNAKLAEIEAYATKASQDWQVPGFAIAIVKNHRVVFAKGFGVKQLGKTDPVDKDTIFAIGSNTKAFTAAALATLVDEGKIRWEDNSIQLRTLICTDSAGG
jgi:CubicO group peptidase (beta-lactamase class C family)